MAESTSRSAIRSAAEAALDFADEGLYLFVALLFLVAALAMGAYSVVTFIKNAGEDFPSTSSHL